MNNLGPGGYRDSYPPCTYTLVPVGAGRGLLPSCADVSSKNALFIASAAWVLSKEAPLDHLAAWLRFYTQEFA